MRFLMGVGLLAAILSMSVASTAQAQLSLDQPPIPVDPPQAVPTLPPPAVLPVRPMTLSEFASAVKPVPGRYEVVLQHPKTRCPVKVCFNLPPGCIRKVRVNSRRIEFVYARQRDVVIRFLRNGTVLVRD